MKKLLLCLLILPSICMAIQYSDQYWAQDGIFALKERAAAPSAVTSWGKIYAKLADKKLYFLDSSGTEYNLLLGGVANLSSLSDVTINTPLDNQVLTYETATGKWKNKAGNIYTFSSPLSESLGTVSIVKSDATHDGYLAMGDWGTFNSKESAITAGTTGQYWRGDKSWQTLDKTAVGLGNVDNTSDVNKPVSTAQATAIANKNAGVSLAPSYTDNGDGSITLGNLKAKLYSTADFTGTVSEYSITGNTFVLTDSDITPTANNYIVADYNGGTPILRNTSNVAEINGSNIIPVYTVYRTGTIIHPLDWDTNANGLPELLDFRLIKTQRFQKEPGGLALSEAATRTILVASGNVWLGTKLFSLAASTSATDQTLFYYHVAGAWSRASITQYNNTQYDNGTALATLTNNRYAVNWVFRGVENAKHIYVVLGTGDYTLAQAQASTIPAVPPIISGHALLVGRIIVQKSVDTATLIQNVSDTTFGASSVQNHNDLSGRSDADAHPSSAITYSSDIIPTTTGIDLGSAVSPFDYIFGNFGRFVKTSTDASDQLVKINQTSKTTTSGSVGAQSLEIYNAVGIADSTTTSGTMSAAYVGAYRNLLVDGTNGNGTLASIIGVSLDYGHGARGTMATGTTTSAYGLYVTPRYSSGTITNMYDIFIANPVTGGTVTNKYGIYQENTAKNYFAGNVGIGTSAPSEKLDVKGTVAISGATSGAVKFAVPAAAGSATYTLPITDGNSGYVLSTNGSGVLSWTANGTGSGASTALDNLASTAVNDSIIPATDNAIDLGSSSPKAFRDIYTRTTKYNGSTSGTVTVSAPATAGTTTFTLPSSNGTDGYYLKTNGSGVTSWADPNDGVGTTYNGTFSTHPFTSSDATNYRVMNSADKITLPAGTYIITTTLYTETSTNPTWGQIVWGASTRSSTDTTAGFSGVFPDSGYGGLPNYMQATQTAVLVNNSHVTGTPQYVSPTASTDYWCRMYSTWTGGSSVKVYCFMAAVRIK